MHEGGKLGGIALKPLRRNGLCGLQIRVRRFDSDPGLHLKALIDSGLFLFPDFEADYLMLR